MGHETLELWTHGSGIVTNLLLIENMRYYFNQYINADYKYIYHDSGFLKYFRCIVEIILNALKLLIIIFS